MSRSLYNIRKEYISKQRGLNKIHELIPFPRLNDNINRIKILKNATVKKTKSKPTKTSAMIHSLYFCDMITSSITYSGGLNTTAVHVRSGNTIETDAPVDNQGKGEAFSPTDLLATSLASCALTTMGIIGNKNNINIDGATADIIKHMAADPRRVNKIEMTIKMPQGKSYTEHEKELMEKTALTCPVAKSLHPDLLQAIEIIW